MNIELLREVQELRDTGKSFTEIADMLGQSRSHIIVAHRVYLIMETHCQSEAQRYQKNIEELQVQLQVCEETQAAQTSIIEHLNTKLKSYKEVVPLIQYEHSLESFERDRQSYLYELEELEFMLEACERKRLFNRVKNLFQGVFLVTPPDKRKKGET